MSPTSPQIDLDQLVSLQRAGASREVSVKTLRRMVARGELPAVRIGVRKPGAGRDTRPIRVRLSDLDRITEPVTITTTGAASS